ncbi:MAG: helix-turn-helix domain-containing protein [Blautia sp.]|nr:helix-turn-helix domain-containing protein [Blautia sp.]
MDDQMLTGKMPSFSMSVNMVRDYLLRQGLKVTVHTKKNGRYKKVALWAPGCEPENAGIYVMGFLDRENMVREDRRTGESKEKNALLVVAGAGRTEDFTPEQLQEELLFLPGKEDKYRIYELLQSYLLELRDWDYLLKDIVYRDGTIRDLGSAAFDFFGSSITIHDENYAILAKFGDRHGIYSSKYYPSAGCYVYTNLTVSGWMDDPAYVESLSTSGAQWWPVENQSDSIYVNMRSDSGNWKGRVILHPGKRVLKEADKELLEHFAGYLRLLMPVRNSISSRINQALQEGLSAALAGDLQLPYVPEILKELYQWRPDDEHVCLYLKPTRYEVYRSTHVETNVCATIEDLLPAAQAFAFRDHIVVVVNLTHARLKVSDVRMKLALVIRENLFLMGVSLPFTELIRLPLFYLQAAAVLELRSRDDTSYTYLFSDYQLEYLIRTIRTSRLSPGIYSEGLNRLEEYDASNGTELSETLKIYLFNERSVKQTASHFHINRTTVTYRLERIGLISGMDLNDPEERLLLQILFKLREEK